MSLDALGPLRAYQQAARAPVTSTPSSEGAGFGTLVQGMVTETAGALRTAEQASTDQLAGRGDLVDVVTAIGAAETALDTMVAVRDRVISAYQDIMRLQI